MELTNINKKDLPPCLKKCRLSEEFDDEITVPKKYVLGNDIEHITTYRLKIITLDDFIRIMDKLRFWIVNKLPIEIYRFVHFHKERSGKLYEIISTQFVDFFFEELKILCLSENDKQILVDAVQIESMNLIEYCQSEQILLTSTALIKAVDTGNLPLLKYLFEEYCHIKTNEHKIFLRYHDAYRSPVKTNHMDMVKYLHNIGVSHTYHILCIAAEHGHYEMSQYLINNGHSVTSSSCAYAAGKNQLKCLKLLCNSLNTRPDSFALYPAVRSEDANYDCFTYLINKYGFNDRYHINNTIFAIFINGSIKCLQFMHDKGYNSQIKDLCRGQISLPHENIIPFLEKHYGQSLLILFANIERFVHFP